MIRARAVLRFLVDEVLAEACAAALVVAFYALLARAGRFSFLSDDRQLQYLPISEEIGRALREGSFPLLAPGSWGGGAIAAEYQHGVFNVFELLCNGIVWNLGLTLPKAAAVLSELHLAVLAAGVVRLARGRDLPPLLGVAAACATATSGWVLGWGAGNWTPAVASFAWVPWFWWALERSGRAWRGPMRPLAPAFFLYLVLTSGWPFSNLLVALVTVVVALRLFDARRLELWPIAATWALGVALSAPALFMLFEYTAVTTRATLPPELNVRWHVPPAALAGWILPSFTATWYDFQGWTSRSAVELTGGAVPWAGILAGLFARGARFVRKERWDIALLVVLVILMTTPGYRLFQHSFRWLPGAMLVLSLLGAHGFDHARRRASEGALGPLVLNAGFLVAAATAFCAVRDVLFAGDAATTTRALGRSLVIVFALWGAALVVFRRQRAIVLASPAAVALASAFLVYRALPAQGAMRWWNNWPAVTEHQPFGREIRYFQAYGLGDVGGVPVAPWDRTPATRAEETTLRPGNTMLHAGLQTVNGYSPFRLLGLAALFEMDVHGDLWGSGGNLPLDRDTGKDGLLGLAGVDGIVLGNGYKWHSNALVSSGEWTIVANDNEATVLHRTALPTPRARCVASARGVPDDYKAVLAGLNARTDARVAPILLVRPAGSPMDEERFAPCTLGEVKDERNASSVDVSVAPGGPPALVVFARPWLPGWRAELDGTSLPVECVDMFVTAVRVPAGAHGMVVLRYFPRSLVRGLAVCAAALASVAVLAFRLRRRRRARAPR